MPIIRDRGRPIADADWAEIAAKAKRTLPADGEFNENSNMVDEWHDGVRSWHGVAIHPKNHNRAFEAVWLTKFYLAGQQRVIGKGTLYQCARLYDAALIHFAKYRTRRPSYFNFDEQQAKHDQGHADFVLYFGAIHDLLEARGLSLSTSEQRSEHSKLHRLDREHATRTASGRIEVRLTAIETLLQAAALRQEKLEQRLSTLTMQITLVLSRLNQTMPVVQPASAELLVDAKNNLTPIESVVSCAP